MAESRKFEWALPLGTTLRGGSYPYEVVEHLGQGGFGITYKVKTRVHINNIGLDAFFAIKEYFPNSCWRDDDGITVKYSRALEEDMKSGLADFITEGERLQEICKLNNNIVSVNEVFQANDTAYYVMEYLEGGDLRNLVKNNGSCVSEAKMMSIMRPIAEAVQCLHDNNMLHLDIKPENIVMRRSRDGRPDEPVLIDFGIAVHFDSKGNPTTKSPSAGVSAGYSPKEQYSNIRTFDPRFDIYALSATCFYLLTGKDPIDSLNMPVGFVAKELPEELSESTANAIVRGMSLDKSGRQHSVKMFLMDFEPQHSLPVGAVIKGESYNYMISEVVSEERDYIQYVATLWNDEQSDSLQQDNSPTSSIVFDVWEWWLPSFKRQGQEVDTEGTVPPIDWWLPKEKLGLTLPGTLSNRNIIAELVEQNNTIYCIKQRGLKTTGLSNSSWLSSHKKYIISAVVALLMAAALGVIGPMVYKSCSKPRYPENSNSDDTSNSDDAGGLASSTWKFKKYVKNEEVEVDGRMCHYTGYVDSKGRPDGDKGKCVFKDGDSYKGEFCNGQMNGHGEYIYEDGYKFEGTFENNIIVKGKYFIDGYYFDGEFMNSKPYNGDWYYNDNTFHYKLVNGKRV